MEGLQRYAPNEGRRPVNVVNRTVKGRNRGGL